jgi:tight adherence protein C
VVTAGAVIAGLAAAAGVAGLGEVAGLLAARPRAARRRRPATALLAGVGRWLGVRAPRSLAARIGAAGLQTPAGEVMAVKAGAAVAGLAAGAVLAPEVPGRLGLVMLAGLPVAGFFAPDLWLRRVTRARVRAVEAELADVLDLLRVAVAAGLAPKRALAEVGRRHAGVLGAELRRAAARSSLGVPIARALDELEARAPAAGVAPLVAALRRSERHGAPLGPALAAQAAEARAARAQQRMEAAARAGPQIQLAVALLLVPAVLLLVAAALLPALAGPG